MIRVLVGAIVLLAFSSVYAAPLIHFQLEGRRQGSADPFASNVEVSLGDVVEYRLRLRMATPGTVNQNLDRRFADQPGQHGVNSLSIDLRQDVSDSIKVDLNLPVDLASDWNRGTGAHGGEPSLRSGSTWHDLLKIRPIQQPGVFRGATELTVFSGLLNVAAISGTSGQVRPEWGTTSGGAAFEGHVFFVVGPNHPNFTTGVSTGVSTEVGPDPFTEFVPLTLTAGATPTPEPSTVVLACSAMIVVFLLRRRIAGAG